MPSILIGNTAHFGAVRAITARIMGLGGDVCYPLSKKDKKQRFIHFNVGKPLFFVLFGLTLSEILILYKNNINMTISFPNSIEPSKIERVLQFLYHERIAFSVEPSSAVTTEDLVIRERLHNKYVRTNEWNTMSLEEKEDAAHLESMLFLEETHQATPLNEVEDLDFKNEIKTWANL